jgi:PleD family two-component response regulator
MIWIFEREASMAGPKHILIVDDNGDVRDVIVDMLQYRGYRVNASMVPTTDIGFAPP